MNVQVRLDTQITNDRIPIVVEDNRVGIITDQVEDIRELISNTKKYLITYMSQLKIQDHAQSPFFILKSLGWAKRSVPIIEPVDGHASFAHPTSH